MQTRESITIDEAIAILNKALKIDRRAISGLVLDHRVRCNSELFEDETIPVSRSSFNGCFIVGLLDILNGLFGGIRINFDPGTGLIKSFSRMDSEKNRKAD
jgi:hypothetical protein